MAQQLQDSFHDPLTAKLRNQRFSLIEAGVYQGFFIKVSDLNAGAIDLIRGIEGSSILHTKEGITVLEDGDLLEVLSPQPANKIFPRRDLIVAEYVFSNDTSIPATYKLITGVPATDAVDPLPENDNQIIIGSIEIPANSLSSVVLSNDNVRLAPRAPDVRGVELAPLKAVVDPNNSLRVLFYPGKYPSSDNTQILEFLGGFGDVVDALVPINGERVIVFGVDDDGDIVVVEDVSDFDAVTDANASIFLLVAARATKDITGTITLIAELRDLRVPIGRLGDVAVERLSWEQLLGDSSFLNMKVQLFNDDDSIYTPPSGLNADVPGDPKIDGVETGDGSGNSTVVVTIDRSTSSLIIDASAASPVGGQDVTVKLNDFLADSPFNFSNFTLIGDSDFVIDYTYASTANPAVDSSFTSVPQQSAPPGDATIQESPAVLSTFIPRLHIDGAQFASGPVTIRALGLLANLESAAQTKFLALSNASTQVEKNVRNLVGNPFMVWSRPDNNGDIPDLADSGTPIAYALDGSDPAWSAFENQFGPDGWFMVNPVAVGGLSALATRPVDPGVGLQPTLRLDSIAGTGAILLEYPIAAGAQYTGQQVSFALTFSAPSWAPGPAKEIFIEIVQHNASGSTTSLGKKFLASNLPNQRVVVQSTAITNTAIAIGLRVSMQAASGPIITLQDPMAAWGSFTDLLFVPSVDPFAAAERYYERGRLTSGDYAISGSQVSRSLPVVRKHLEMGTIRNSIITSFSESLDSETVGEIDTERQFKIAASVKNTGDFLFDVIYESALIPEGFR